MVGSKREREVARAKYERQQARRSEHHDRRQQRTRLTAAITLTLLAVSALVAITLAVQPQQTTPVADPTRVVCLYETAGEPARPLDGRPPLTTSAEPPTTTATITLAQGPVTVELLNAAAPCTVNSFTFLAEQGFYDDTPCHRLTAGTLNVLQCGDPSGTGTGGPGYTFADENLDGATYPAGTLAMANSGPNTNGSQFFVVYADSQLGPSYTPFGRVVGGLDVVSGIAAAGIEGGADDGAPAKPVTIESVTVAEG